MTVLLIDLSSILHPLWHMSAGEPDPNATATKTVERVRALASGMPHVAICCDSGKSFRATEVDANYKAQRPDSDARLMHQQALAIETLEGDGFPVWRVKGFEADDLIASAAAQLDCDVLIASADKDLLALVDDRVKIKSLKDGAILGAAEVVAKFGVAPNQVVEYLMLCGDKADNIVGAKGIGPKRAADLLTQYGNLTDLYASDFTKLSASLQASLNEFLGRMPTVRTLVTMRSDVPLPVLDVLTPRELPATDWATPELTEEQDERAAIMEYDGGLTRQEAEKIVTRNSLVDLMTPPAPAPAKLSPVAAVVLPPVAPEPVAQVPLEPEIYRPAPRPITPRLIPAQPPTAELMAIPSAAAPAPSDWNRQLDPRSIGEAKALATDLHASRLFSAYGNPPAVLSTILAGREIGLTAMASLRAFHIIDGKPTLAADLIRAIVLRSGAAKFFRVVERTPAGATWETQRGDDPPVRLSYTIEEATAAGLVKAGSGWAKNPADMLTARASSKLARLVYPDLVHGFYAPDEIVS